MDPATAAPVPPSAAAEVPVLEMRHITMRFGSFRALRDVDFLVNPGEIVALLGENGSGKSTLVKVLAGVNAPDPGAELYLGGRPVPLPLTLGQFRDLGLSFVHQDLGLARPLTVAENLVVAEAGSAHSRRPINWRAERGRIRKLLESYQVGIDPAAVIDRLPPVGQALVAIVRAAEELKAYRLRGDVAHSILFLDEPTVFLPESEVEFLFELVRTVVRAGASVVFISHDLSAVRAVCDRAVVLRDGEVAGRTALAGVSDERLVELIVGSGAGKRFGYGHRRGGAGAEEEAGAGATADAAAGAGTGAAAARRAVCEVRGLRGGRVADLSLDIRDTEIVGLAGLLGSGAEDVPYLLFGSATGVAGSMTVDGWTASVPRLKPFEALHKKVALVPADRRRDGIAPALTVAENATILVNHEHTSFGRLRLRRLRRLVRDLLDRFNVRPRDPGAAAWQLSGGNQQRVVLAKWLEINPKLLLLHEPTQGVDVAARAQIYRMVRDATDAGMATLWVSSDFEELAAVCDRVIIVAAGLVRAELSGTELTEDKISSAVYYYSTDAASVLAEDAASQAGPEQAPRTEGRDVDG